MLDDIEHNGSPQGWHSGPTKNNYVALFKDDASQTNCHHKTLDAQIGSCNAESFIINSAFQKMTMAYSEDNKNNNYSDDCLLGI